MQGTWVTYENHIALRCANEILHPSAVEIYAALKAGKNILDEIECPSIYAAFPDAHFSKVGSDIKCLLENGANGEICMRLFVDRKGKEVDVDVIDGQIIDQCITNDEWFYVTGSTTELGEAFIKAGIKRQGKITVSQYVFLTRKSDDLLSNTIINKVVTSLLDKPIDMQAEVPIGLNANLYAYQKTGYLWMKYMLSENKGCILGDDMGLGKTLQVITLMLDYQNRGQTPILVVAPVSLLQNWKRECERFAPKLKVFIHHGPKRTGRYVELEEYDVIIISYNTAVSDSSLLGMIEWKLVVLDEAQSIKNPASVRAKYVKLIPRKTCVAVSGTPFENHVTDIWSLVDFVMPGLLGTQSEYTTYISDDVEGADKVEPLLSPIMIRRMVADVASDLPERVIIPQPIIMSEPESVKYEVYRHEASISYESDKIGLGALQKLRMYCAHPHVCEEELSINPYDASIKYQRMCEILEEIIIRKEKVILFTSYHKMFDILEADIPGRFCIPVMKINGSTPVNERQAIVDNFNAYEGSILLVLNPRAAGIGLNITAANHVIHYNLEWNPALEDQASARAYRRGQQKTVFIYRLYYANTVEQIVNDRIEDKRSIAEAAIVGIDGNMENKKDIIAALNISPLR